MKTIQKSLLNAAMVLASATGRFGDIGKAEKFAAGANVSGSHKFRKKKKAAKQRPQFVAKDADVIASELAYGQSRYRELRKLWYPRNTASQIPGSRRNGRGQV